MKIKKPVQNCVTADQEFLKKQYNILKLFVNVKQPNYDQEQAQTGNAFDFRNQINNFSVSSSETVSL